jgi:hypothetical protein
VIDKIKHKGLRRLHEKNDRSGIRPDLVDKVRKIPSALGGERPGRDGFADVSVSPLTGDRRQLRGDGQGQLARHLPLS